MDSKTNLDLEIKQGQDDFIKNLREIEKKEKREKQIIKRKKRCHLISRFCYLVALTTAITALVLLP